MHLVVKLLARGVVDRQGDVATIGIPDSMNVIAEYPIARVAGGNAALGQAFIDAVLSAAGQQTLQAHGFH